MLKQYLKWHTLLGETASTYQHFRIFVVWIVFVHPCCNTSASFSCFFLVPSIIDSHTVEREKKHIWNTHLFILSMTQLPNCIAKHTALRALSSGLKEGIYCIWHVYFFHEGLWIPTIAALSVCCACAYWKPPSCFYVLIFITFLWQTLIVAGRGPGFLNLYCFHFLQLLPNTMRECENHLFTQHEQFVPAGTCRCFRTNYSLICHSQSFQLTGLFFFFF